MDSALIKNLQDQVEALRVVIVDDDHYMRKVVRTMLATFGARTVFEASDGMSGLDLICKVTPDLVIVDWEMPLINGSQFVRMVRSPSEFPVPDVPIIMLTGHGDRWRVEEAARIGAHEFLLKPVSTKALHDRVLSILCRPRPTVRLDDYYGPMPRNMATLRDGTQSRSREVLTMQPKTTVPAPSQTEPTPKPAPIDRTKFGLRKDVVQVR
jgi:two-component system, chemotaxis family, chemotaxis protein CheY